MTGQDQLCCKAAIEPRQENVVDDFVERLPVLRQLILAAVELFGELRDRTVDNGVRRLFGDSDARCREQQNANRCQK